MESPEPEENQDCEEDTDIVIVIKAILIIFVIAIAGGLFYLIYNYPIVGIILFLPTLAILGIVFRYK